MCNLNKSQGYMRPISVWETQSSFQEVIKHIFHIHLCFSKNTKGVPIQLPIFRDFDYPEALIF